MLTGVLIGAGDRGSIYANGLIRRGGKIAAISEPQRSRLIEAGKAFNVPSDRLFENDGKLFAVGKIADFAIISTLDEEHFKPAMKALQVGYDLLLEKPISNKIEEVLMLANEAKRLSHQVVVCHVLRYSPFFSTIKQILEEGSLGRIIDIQHNENIGNFHFAHSYVRGNWRKEETSSPLILAKSCHDLDLLLWLTSSSITRVSSFGSLSYFNAAHAPKDAADRCVYCPLQEKCRYSAYQVYLPMKGSWPATVIGGDQSEEGLKKAIAEGPYGRCVYHCDNDVVDHQVSIYEFANGVSATFNLSAFTDRVSRTVKIMCENGEIRGNEIDNVIEVIPFSSTPNAARSVKIYHPEIISGAHNGSDNRFIDDFFQVFSHQKPSDTSIDVSVESHLVAFASEESRHNHQVVEMEAFRKDLESHLTLKNR